MGGGDWFLPHLLISVHIMKIVLFILISISLASCGLGEKDRPVIEDIDWVNRPKSEIDLTFNPDSEAIVREAGNIWFFVYDEDGVLRAKFKATEKDIEAGLVESQLPDGKHTVVAWGTRGEDLYGDENGYAISGDAVGSSRMEDLQVIVDDVQSFDDLYYSQKEIDIVNGNVSNDAKFDFIRQTSILRVTIRGLEVLPALRSPYWTPSASGTRAPESPIDIYIEGKKSVYNYTGRIDDSSPVDKFRGVTKEASSDHVVSEIHIQRLLVDYHDNNPLLLHVSYNGNDIVTPIDVLDTILEHPEYNTQADLDLQYEYNVEMALSDEGGDGVDVEVGLSVDGYDVIDLEVDVEPFFRR